LFTLQATFSHEAKAATATVPDMSASCQWRCWWGSGLALGGMTAGLQRVARVVKIVEIPVQSNDKLYLFEERLHFCFLALFLGIKFVCLICINIFSV